MTQINNKNRNSGGSSIQAEEEPETELSSDDLQTTADEFINFLKNSDGKKALIEFLTETYNKIERQKIAQLQERLENEKKVDQTGATPFHTPSNIEPLLHQELNMARTEEAFVRSLRSTQQHLVRSVEERVEEINRLLSNIGGFSAQLKSSFARSTVVFLEQEDPKYPFRERLVFSINLPNYELKKPWNHSKGQKLKQVSNSNEDPGRSSLQATWDEAVNALAKIVETTGLKPKYCKNDRHYGRFVMKQDLRSYSNLPDEYFSFTLDYNTEEKIKDMCVPYDKIVKDYEAKITRLEKKLSYYSDSDRSTKFLQLKKSYLQLTQERDFFVGTTPDPNQLDEGLLFLIEVSTLKDYHIVKDRMQSIMTQYILYLSKIASQDEEDKIEISDISAGDLKKIPEYTVDIGSLRPAEELQQEKKIRRSASKKRKAA